MHFEQGLTYAEMQRQRDAFDCFLKSTQCHPPLQPAFVNISAILEQQEQYEESLQWARKAIELERRLPIGATTTWQTRCANAAGLPMRLCSTNWR